MDWRAGQICAALYNLKRNARVKPDPFQPRDFMPLRRAKTEQEEPTLVSPNLGSKLRLLMGEPQQT